MSKDAQTPDDDVAKDGQPSAPASEPLVHPEVRRQMESLHESEQRARWGAVFKLMTERERAEKLADLELNLAWDRLGESERASALAAVEADRQWPGTFERMEEEPIDFSAQETRVNLPAVPGAWQQVELADEGPIELAGAVATLVAEGLRFRVAGQTGG